MGRQYEARSDKDVHFTGAIAQNAVEAEDIALTGNLKITNGRVRTRVRFVRLISDENLAWEVWFYARDTKRNADLDQDTFLGRVVFAAADGLSIAGAAPFYYFKDQLNFLYEDLDESAELHVELVNRSVAAKSAGAAGEVRLEVGLEKDDYD